jgi:hypothetical protein
MLKGAQGFTATQLAAMGLATVVAPTDHQTTVGQVGGTATIGTVQDIDVTSSPVFAKAQTALVNKNAAISVALSANAGSGAAVTSTNVKSGLPYSEFTFTVGTGPASGVQATITFNNGVTLDSTGTLGAIGQAAFCLANTGAPVFGSALRASASTATVDVPAALTAGQSYVVRVHLYPTTV